MNWTVSGILFVLGIGLGVIFAPRPPSGSSDDNLPDQREMTVVKAREISGSTDEVLERIFMGSSINSRKLAEAKSAEDWLKLIFEPKNQTSDLLGSQDQFLDKRILLKMIPDEHLEEVINGIQRMRVEGYIVSQGMPMSIISLAKRWYVSQPDRMKEWALGDAANDGGIDILIAAAIEHRPEDGIVLYEEHRDKLISARTNIIGGIEPKIASSKLKLEGVASYWKYYDSLPLNASQSIIWGLDFNMETEEYVEFYNEYTKRLKEGNDYSITAGQEALFNGWGSNDPMGLENWYISNRDSLDINEKADVLVGLLNASENSQDKFIKGELAADTDLYKDFLTDSYTGVFGGNDTIKRKLDLLPENTEVASEMITPAMNQMYWSDPKAAIELANHITDSESRFEAVRNIVNSNFNNPRSADLVSLEKNLENLELTNEQKLQILEVAKNKPEQMSDEKMEMLLEIDNFLPAIE